MYKDSVIILGGGTASQRDGVQQLNMSNPDAGWKDLAPIPIASNGQRGRWTSACTLLPPENGGPDKILVAGGGWDGSTWQSTMIYDILSNTWSKTGSLPVQLRHRGAMTSLGNGRVLLLGGYYYDSRGKKWTDGNLAYEFLYSSKSWKPLPFFLKSFYRGLQAVTVPGKYFDHHLATGCQ